MPIKIAKDLPARSILENENIFVMDEQRAIAQDIRPLQILILNLMPIKQDTELQLLRALSNTPLQLDITFLQLSTHVSKNTSASHINKFYDTFDDIKHRTFDGMIITGAPIEQLEFEEVTYWEEMKKIMEWSTNHITSTLHLCWGAQAALYYHYGIKKELLSEKVFGIFEHTLNDRKVPLVRGFDDVFYAPHSRHTTICKKDIENTPSLRIISESEEAGIFLVMTEDGKRIFLMGHPEYDRITLDTEYKRDIGKGLDIKVPAHYYPDDDPSKKPLLTWRSHANNIYTNWINYYVYQLTPYELQNIK